MKSDITASRYHYEDGEHCSGSDRVFAMITSLAFAELAAMNSSYSGGVPILTCTLPAHVGIWQAFWF